MPAVMLTCRNCWGIYQKGSTQRPRSIKGCEGNCASKDLQAFCFKFLECRPYQLRSVVELDHVSGLGLLNPLGSKESKVAAVAI